MREQILALAGSAPTPEVCIIQDWLDGYMLEGEEMPSFASNEPHQWIRTNLLGQTSVAQNHIVWVWIYSMRKKVFFEQRRTGDIVVIQKEDDWRRAVKKAMIL
jgi:hypothetical protein